MAKIKEEMDQVDSKAYDAGSASPPRKSGVPQKDELDTIAKRVDNRVLWSSDEKPRRKKG